MEMKQDLLKYSEEWSTEEDKQLIELANSSETNSWTEISKSFLTRTPQQCNKRWLEIMKTESLKGHWTTEEDNLLRGAVDQYGSRNWQWISRHIPGRSGKQCRERWQNVVNPQIKKGDWTPEEDEKIFELIKKHGRQWTQISKELPGRTENSIKNRFYSSYRSIIRKNKKKDLSAINQLLMGNQKHKNCIEQKLLGLINNNKESKEQQQRMILSNTIQNLSQQISLIQNQISTIKDSIKSKESFSSQQMPSQTINQFNQFNYPKNLAKDKTFILIPVNFYQQEQEKKAQNQEFHIKMEEAN